MTQAAVNQSLVSFIHDGEIIWLQKGGGQSLNKYVLLDEETSFSDPLSFSFIPGSQPATQLKGGCLHTHMHLPTHTCICDNQTATCSRKQTGIGLFTAFLIPADMGLT